MLFIVVKVFQATSLIAAYSTKSTFLSPHADRHAGDISVTVCYCLFVFLFFCLSAGSLVTDISGVGWRRATKFCRMVDLGVCQIISFFGELWPRG